MGKKGFLVTILLVCLVVGILLPSAGGMIRGEEWAAGVQYLPVVVNLKALTPFLVKNINTKTPSSFIYCPQAVGNKMLCSAHDQDHGYELWQSNGQEGGASLLKDIDLAGDSYALHPSASWAKLNDEVLFTAGDFDPGLWRSDGTKQGTQLVKGEFWQLGGEEPFTVAGDLMYFLANDGEHGHELWRSDGSSNGTHMVKDIWPGAHNMGIYNLTPLADELYFIVEGDDYYTLWVSDGTSGGTKQVSVVSHAVVMNIVAFDDTLIMDMIDLPAVQSSLWRTDGTAEGTELISDYGPYKGLELSDFASLDSQVVFIFRRENYEGWGIGTTDGSNAGTSLFSISEEPAPSPLNLIAAGSQAFFFEERYADDVLTLWRTDGTAAGTVTLGKFKKPDHVCSEDYYVIDSKMYFPADDGTHGCELWVSDGTPQGTRMVSDIAQGGKSAWPRPGVFFKERLYFSATDSSGDAELWRTDGTAVGTVRADDVQDSPSASSNPGHIIAQPQGIYLSAWTGDESGVWRSDGTNAGTVPVKSFGSTSLGDSPLHSADWAMAGGMLYLLTESPGAVWRSSGTEAGTVMLSGPEECGLPSMVTAVGDKVFFFAHARGEWLCLAGEPHVKVKYLDDTVVDTVATDSLLYIRFSSGKIGVSDGSAAGTKVYDAPLLTIGPSYPLAVIGETVYFNGCTKLAYDCELWKLEGGHGAPERVMDIVPDVGSSNPRGLVALNDSLIFTAVGPTFGPLLWRSDGTLETTWPVYDVVMCGGPQYGATAAVVGNKLYFAGIDSETTPHSDIGCELWVTDGRYQGTRLVKDIYPGLNHSYPGTFTAAGAHVIFTADDGQHGCELWASDGSGKGTFRIPGFVEQQGGRESGSRAGHCPEQLTFSNGRLYFSDYGSEGDNELWALLTQGVAE